MKRNQQTEAPVCRLYGEVRAFKADVEETRTIEFEISNGGRDRHRTVLNPEGWQLDNYGLNPIVGYQHNVYGGDMCNPDDPDDIIGRSVVFREGEKLIGRVTFEPAELNPKAEKIFRKVLFGSLRMASVGFQEVGQGRWGTGDQARGAANETYYFDGQELLEWSIVNIPSNPTAAARAMRDQTSNALMYVKRALGSDYSFADLETMTVGQVLRLLDKAHGRAMEDHNKPKDSSGQEGDSPEIQYLQDMIPHHEMAVSMSKDALAVLQDPEIYAFCEKVIAQQSAEITQMQEWVQQLEAGSRSHHQGPDAETLRMAEEHTFLSSL